jgi:tyrosinase
MERFVSDPLTVPPPAAGHAWSAAELIVYGVDHLGPSYEVRVFLDAPGADAVTPLELESGYAGCFTVFGHGGCFGDDDHCDPGARFSDEYDVRLPHQSLPQTKVVDVTAALRAATGDAVTVTLVAVEPDESGGPRPSDAFEADEIRLVTYAGAGDVDPAGA